jgi:hypothetical protein
MVAASAVATAAAKAMPRIRKISFFMRRRPDQDDDFVEPSS